MSRSQQVQRRLGDADVRFQADDDDLGGRRRRGEVGVGGQRGEPHAEAGLVEVGLDQGVGCCGGQGGLELGGGVAEAGAVLGGDEDWDLEGGGGEEEFVGCEDAGLPGGLGWF